VKKVFTTLIALALLAVSCSGVRSLGGQGGSTASETGQVLRGNLAATVEGTGVVRANQTALLTWRTSGRVSRIDVKEGDLVSSGQELASLEQTTLPKNIILAQADLIDGQRALEDLQASQTQRAKARQALDQAQQALDDARSPELTQARAGETLANAQKAADDAQRQVDILTSPVPQSAIDQAYANMLLAKNVLSQTQALIARIQKKLDKNPKNYFFFESRSLYRKILKNLEIKRSKDQLSYEEAVKKYNSLLEPANATDLAVAQAELEKAKAQLAQAQRDWKRSKDGTSPADLSLLEAQLADTQREWDRLKDGPDPKDIAAVQARIAAAQAAITQSRITAPFDGVLTQVANQAGDQVSTGSLAFRLDDLSHILADVQITEIDINQIQVGRTVVLKFDSIPSKVYQGIVRDVPMVGEISQGVANFDVLVELTNADELVKPGMTASATIVVNELKDVLQVPKQAIRSMEGRRVVFILRDGKPVPVDITLGISSDIYTQVLAGDLQVGDQVLLNPPPELFNSG
jgi:HlyD family secretion protein